MNRLLRKISAAELDRVRAKLRRDAALTADEYAPTFLPDKARQTFRLQMEVELLRGLEEILRRPGRGPKGTIGRQRMRRAVSELVYSWQVGLVPEALMLEVQADFGTRLRGLVSSYETGTIDFPQLQRQARSLVRAVYPTVYRLGRLAAEAQARLVPTQPLPATDLTRAVKLTPREGATIYDEIDEELDFLDGFLAELQRRKETGEAFGTYANWRANLYTQALRPLFYWGLLGKVGAKDSIYWRVYPPAEHCQDCVEIAARSPYTRATLPTVPGRGDTQCLSNCRCRLDIVKGG